MCDIDVVTGERCDTDVRGCASTPATHSNELHNNYITLGVSAT